MPLKLKFGAALEPKPLNFKDWKPVRGEARTIWLPDDEFDGVAIKHGYDPKTTDGLAIWGQWWVRNTIYLRARSLSLFPHEAQHIERRTNFHEEQS